MIQPLAPILALAFAFGTAAPTTDTAKPTWDAGDVDAEKPSVIVVVSSKLAAEDSRAVETLVRDAVHSGLRARGLVPAELGAIRLNVAIAWDESHDGYTLTYDTRRLGERARTRTSECPRCGSDALLELIEKDLDALRPLLHPEPAPQPAPAPAATDEVAPPTKPSPRTRRIGPMGIVGASLLGTGFAATVPGIVLAAIGDLRTVDPENSELYEVTKRRTPGLVLVGLGGAAMVVGAVLVGIDVAKRRGSGSSRAGRVGMTAFGLAVRW